jgi:hypothetical protein
MTETPKAFAMSFKVTVDMGGLRWPQKSYDEFGEERVEEPSGNLNREMPWICKADYHSNYLIELCLRSAGRLMFHLIDNCSNDSN